MLTMFDAIAILPMLAGAITYALACCLAFALNRRHVVILATPVSHRASFGRVMPPMKRTVLCEADARDSIELWCDAVLAREVA